MPGVDADDAFTEEKFVIRHSRHGPLLGDLYPGLLPDWAPPVAIHWNHNDAAESLAASEGGPLTERTLRDTEARIQETLNLDYETFVNASFFLQGKADQFDRCLDSILQTMEIAL